MIDYIQTKDVKASHGDVGDIASQIVSDEVSVYIQHSVGPHKSVNSEAWLITFTDIMALMLTFFVLLFSMSIPDEGLFDQTPIETLDVNKFMGHSQFAGDTDVISIARKSQKAGLNLSYLSSLIEQAGTDNPRLQDITLMRNSDRLVLVLPEEVKFPKGSIELSKIAKETLRDLAGVLNNIDNQIVVVGHADPTGAENPDDYWVNWNISMRRAQEVAMVLSQYGLNQNMVVRGLSQARYKELPKMIDEEARMRFARRVDIVIKPEQAE